jgi:hypothetical protein
VVFGVIGASFPVGVASALIGEMDSHQSIIVTLRISITRRQKVRKCDLISFRSTLREPLFHRPFIIFRFRNFASLGLQSRTPNPLGSAKNSKTAKPKTSSQPRAVEIPIFIATVDFRPPESDPTISSSDNRCQIVNIPAFL